GFEATSMRDLSAATGLSGPSLYNTFGDKAGLFSRALRHYVETGSLARITRLERDLPPRAALVAFFEDIVTRSLGDDQNRGCLLVNSALELSPHDPVLRAEITRILATIEGFFLRCLRAGQADGTIPAGGAAEDLSRLMLALLMGLRVLARSRPEPALMWGALAPVMQMIGAPMREQSAISVS
ncbi:TetR/AcrR family transcriptional regulator, partial [Thioclava sp. BHET1]